MFNFSPHTRSARAALGAALAAAALVGGLIALPQATYAYGAASDASSVSFVDDFTGPAGSAVDTNKWSYQTGTGWNGGTQNQYYRSGTANAALTGHGTLLITAKGGSYTGPDHKNADYTSARLISKQSVLYGTMSARIRMTGSPGAFPAFWSMGANYAQVGWPACGEIDTMEALNNYPNLYGSFHGPINGHRGTAYNAGKMISPSGGLGTGWHVYSATWTPTSVTFLLDGTPYATVEKADLPANNSWALDSPEQLILNVAVGGMAGTPAAPADFHATMEVDYVRVTNLTTTRTSAPAPPRSGTAPTVRHVAPILRKIMIRYTKHHRAYLVGWVTSAGAGTRVSGRVRMDGKRKTFSRTTPMGTGRFRVRLPVTRGRHAVHVTLRLRQAGRSAVVIRRTVH